MIDFLQGKWLKHPLHPALVHIPAALWPAAFAFDLLSQFRTYNAFVQLSFYGILLGLLVALLAIPTGYADWTDIRPEKPAWKLGLASGLFILSGALGAYLYHRLRHGQSLDEQVDAALGENETETHEPVHKP